MRWGGLLPPSRGSMELLADRDAEDARKILAPVPERMMEAVPLKDLGKEHATR